MKVSDLEGPELDYWVAKALGGEVSQFYSGEGLRMVPTKDFPGLEGWDLSFSRLNMDPETMNGMDYCFHPSTDWRQGGPLMEKYEIDIGPEWDNQEANETGNMYWRAYSCRRRNKEALERFATGLWDNGIGPTPLIALCRAIVASVYGDSVDE